MSLLLDLVDRWRQFLSKLVVASLSFRGDRRIKMLLIPMSLINVALFVTVGSMAYLTWAAVTQPCNSNGPFFMSRTLTNAVVTSRCFTPS